MTEIVIRKIVIRNQQIYRFAIIMLVIGANYYLLVALIVLENDEGLREWRALREEQDRAFEESLRIDQEKVKSEPVVCMQY